MVLLVPMVTEKAEALISAKATFSYKITVSNLKWHLSAGKWVETPHFWDIFNGMVHWTTKGSGIFGGDEKGIVEADVQRGPWKGHVTLSWFNPDRGANLCGIKITGPTHIFSGRCTIEQDAIADADYRIFAN